MNIKLEYYSSMLGTRFPSEEMKKGAEQKAILDQQKRHNELIEEQNRLLRKNTPVVNYNDSSTFLGIIAELSIFVLIFGIISLIFLPEGTTNDIRQISINIIIGSSIAPILWIFKQICKFIFKPIINKN